LPVICAFTDLHLQLPLHTWECTGFVDSISGMLSLRVSQNKEPSSSLNSDTKVTTTCVRDCFKKKIGKRGGKQKIPEAKETKGKVGKANYLPSKELNLQIWELSAFVAFKYNCTQPPPTSYSNSKNCS
jgi:hypothetical protein